MIDSMRIVEDYIERLVRLTEPLPADRRIELVGEVREHIVAALAEIGRADDVAIQAVLGRLGSPAEIVAAEVDPSSARLDRGAPPRGPAARAPLSVERRALIWFTVGSIVVPFAGPIIGLWTATASLRWSLAQKRTAAMIVFALLALPAVVLLPAIVAGELTWVVTSGGFLLPFVPLAGLVAGLYLVVSSSVVLTISRR